MNCELYILNGVTAFQPAVEDGITWSTDRKGSPGKLIFKAVQDGKLNIQEGNAVQFKADGVPVFYGYIFTLSWDKEGVVSVTCYDQLRYFKNKDTYVYVGLTASQVLQRICADFRLRAGVIEDTGHVIARKSEQNKTLFDIVQSALDDTLMSTKRLYVLYDNFGVITLQNIASMRVPLLIDEETGQNYDYTSSIDTQTYNKIKLVRENKDAGTREVYIAQDGERMNEWGILQYYETLQEADNGQQKADALLSLYNRKTKNLNIKGAFGDVRIRAGASPLIRLALGDIFVNNFMVCDKATHKFSNGEHTMELTLIGGDFVA